MKKLLIALTLGAAMAASAQVPIQLENVTMKQNAWTRVVEVTYDLTGDTPDGVFITLDVTTNGVLIPPPVAVSGDISTEKHLKIVAPGNTTKKIIWDSQQDWSGNVTTQAQAVVTAWFTNNPPDRLPFTYVVVDLSGGPTATIYPVRKSMAPPNLSDPAVKTTELWLRRIPAGTFTMGSPPNEPYRGGVNETEHQVTLTQDFYIGVFQMTQKQYELVMGYNPSDYKGDARPVEMASYDDVRGVLLGSQWPANNQVDASSFMGKLRAKTGLTFDLPTEAQWEYACRAGTTTALNNGKYMTTDDGSCPNVAEVARFGATSVTGGTAWDGKGGYSGNFHTVVGMYKPNNWGLYDMHGNLWEWCLDYYDGTDYSAQAVTDPRGIVSGPQRVYRGAGYATILVSSARRNGVKWDSRNNWTGFRVCIQP